MISNKWKCVEIEEDMVMREWMDLNGNGKIDGFEHTFAEEML